jgi:integrase
MSNRRVSIIRRVQIDGRWKFVYPIVSDKGRVSPEFVKLKGQTVRVTGGEWYIAWYEGTKKMRKPVGPRLTEAVAEKVRQTQRLAAQNVGITIEEDDGSRTRIVDAIETFLDDLRLRDRQGETVQAYQLVLYPFADSCQKTFVDQIDRTDVLRYSKRVRNQGRSPRTVFNRFTSLQTFLKANGIKIMDKRDWPRYVDSEPEVYTVEELQKFFAACDDEQHLLCQFLLKTGARMQEAMFACWSDLDFKNRTFRVTAKPALGFSPKSWEEREIPLEEGLAARLEARRKTRTGTTLVFPTRNGNPNNKLLQTLKRVARRAGLNCGQCSTCLRGAGTQQQECERWFLHKFRATFATMHLQAGVDLRTVQSWLGHKDLASTMRYLKPARGKEVRARFNQTFAGLSEKLQIVPPEGQTQQQSQAAAAAD